MATGKYYILDDIKPMLSIAESDVEDDILLNNFGLIADKQIDNELSDKLVEFPILNANITADIESAANLYVSYLYKIKKQDFDGAKNFKELYDNNITALRTRLTHDNNSTSGRVAIGKGYTTSPLSDE